MRYQKSRPSQIDGAISTSPDRLSENVIIQPVIIAELKFGHIQRQILLADLVECPDHPALNQRPKAFDGVGVNRSDDILPSGVIDHDVREVFIQMLVTHPLVRTEKAHAGRDAFMDELLKRRGADVGYDTGDDAPLAAYRSRDNGLTGADATSSVPAPAFILMPVLGLAAGRSLPLETLEKMRLARIKRNPSLEGTTHVRS